MILPTKGITADRALLSVGAEVLGILREPMTVSRLWNEVQKQDRASRWSFDWFVLALDLLYLMGLITMEHGRIFRVPSGQEGS